MNIGKRVSMGVPTVETEVKTTDGSIMVVDNDYLR